MKIQFRGLWGSLLLLGATVASGDDYYLSNGDQDATILLDEYQDTLWPWSENVAVGDFNGDGSSDLAVRSVHNLESGITVIFGRHFKKTSTLSEAMSFRIPLLSETAGPGNPIALGDVSGDKMDELFVSRVSSGTIFVVSGQSSPDPSIDLQSHAFKIVGTAGVTGKSIVLGDFNGDGIDDMATGYQRGDSRKAIAIVFGSTRPASDVTLASDPGVSSVVLNNTSWDIKSIRKGRFSRAGADDLVAWIETPSSGQIVVLGTMTWEPIWDLNTSLPTAQMNYSRSDPFFGKPIELSMGDISGDGIEDFVFNKRGSVSDPTTQRYADGEKLLSLGLWNADWTNTSPMLFSMVYNPDFYSTHLLDFDGNGIKDLVGLNSPTLSLNLYMDSSRGGDPAVTFIYASTFLRLFWTKALNTIVVPGDFNGDGCDDILVHSDVEGRRDPNRAPWSMLSFYYGFRPLVNPTVQLRARPVASSRADLDLGVGGDPAEMRLSGHIMDVIKDQWIPYQTAYTVTLSPSVGAKTVQATFRNSFQRESAMVSASLTQSVAETHTAVVTNRMGAERNALVDCHLAEPAHVRAEVVSLAGAPVKTLMDESQGPGIVSLEWDGTGSDGRRLAPGVYVLVVDINDKRETHQVLLKQ